MPRARPRRRGRPPRNPPGTARSSPRGPPRHDRRRSPPRRAAGVSAERAPELVEEALVVAVRVGVARRLELEQQAALVVAQPPWDGHVDEHSVVAAAKPLEHRHTLPLEDTYV